MEKQLISHGNMVMEVGNILQMVNHNTKMAMAFKVVDIDNGYVVIQPLDFKRFNNDPKAVNDYLANKAIVRGLITNR